MFVNKVNSCVRPNLQVDNACTSEALRSIVLIPYLLHHSNFGMFLC